MPLIFNSDRNIIGTEGDDFLFGDSSPSTQNFTGNGGNDFILANASAVFSDTNANNAALSVSDSTSLSAALAAAMNIDDVANWTSQRNPAIENDVIPHATVYAAGGEVGSSNYYTVTVGAGETLTVDVDGASEGLDTLIKIFDGVSTTSVASNDNSMALDLGSLSTQDSFVTLTNTTGAVVTYLIEVDEASGGNIEATDQYLLNVSVTEHAVGTGIVPPHTNIINGGAGDDILFGGEGFDRFFASDNDGDDYIYGGLRPVSNVVDFRNVTLGVTVDLNIVGPQDTGGTGVDTFVNINWLQTSQGDDHITLSEDGGIITDRGGNDTLLGGSSGNLFRLGLNDGNDFIDGGGGFDSLDYTFVGASVTIDLNLTTAQDTGNAGIDTLLNFERLTGSSREDILTASDLVGTDINGGNGDDIINGGAVSDVLEGAQGRDSIFGGAGDDIVEFSQDTDLEALEIYDGGAGDDVLAFGRSGTYDFREVTTLSNFEEFAAGRRSEFVLQLNSSQWNENSISTLSLDQVTSFQLDLFIDTDDAVDLSNLIIEGVPLNAPLFGLDGDTQDNTILGTQYSDNINGADGDDVLQGLNGDDTLNGGTGRDSLDGGDGNDRLEGGVSNDTLLGGRGGDILVGGSGNDIINGQTGFDTALYVGLNSGVTVDLTVTSQQNTGGGGRDTLLNVENLVGTGHDDSLTGSANRNRLEGNNGDDTLIGLGNNDTLIGGAGADVLDGGTGADQLFGGTGGDSLFGGAGRDRLLGGEGSDRLFGGEGVDRLIGGAGNDVLVGGRGTDFLFGGAGPDRFDYNDISDSGVGPFNRDEIRDFNSAEGDRIDVFGIDADINTSGNQAFNVVSDEFTGTAGEIMIQSLVRSGVNIQLVSFDVDGDSRADMQIWVLANELDASDFVL